MPRSHRVRTPPYLKSYKGCNKSLQLPSPACVCDPPADVTCHKTPSIRDSRGKLSCRPKNWIQRGPRVTWALNHNHVKVVLTNRLKNNEVIQDKQMRPVKGDVRQLGNPSLSLFSSVSSAIAITISIK